MSTMMDCAIKRWTAKRKSALVLEIIQGKTTVSAASRQLDLSPHRAECYKQFNPLLKATVKNGRITIVFHVLSLQIE